MKFQQLFNLSELHFEMLLPERFCKRLNEALLIFAVFCSSVSGVFGDDLFEERQWTGKNGNSFTGIFWKKDFATGNYFFSKSSGKVFMVAADSFCADDAALIEARWEKRQKEAMPPPPIIADKPLVFSKSPLQEREWMNKEGKRITGSLVEVSREKVTMQTGARKVSIPLENLAQDDQTAALLWTAATNEAIEIPEATFYYRVVKNKKVVTRFSIEISGTFSRILIAEAPLDGNGKAHPFETRFTTDHSNGTFQSEQRKQGYDWHVNSIGKWDDRYRVGGDIEQHHRLDYGVLLGKFADSEMTSVGPWLVRETQLGEKPPWPLTASSIAYLRLPRSNLAAALRYAVSAPIVVDVDKRAASDFYTEVWPFSSENGGSLFDMDNLLETLRVQDLDRLPKVRSFKRA